ncbi:hypothetical protein IB277_31120 [Ensifer sp. ENS07]|uniref:hypothetical protein n=1 Tax=Ensifer sp. ENS07 TaxID=2769274 RepID=UPI0017817A8D|nr:hypothetical protein [Ensifer sp. ENS07]MBD9640751.1 hypothetical protein [Ensifer sp. ENS07]
MKYYVQFQEFNPKNGRPIDHPSEADFEATDSGMIPQVGDYVNIQALKDPANAPSYSGRVRSRLFSYMGPGACGINIVVEPDGVNWGELIKE